MGRDLDVSRYVQKSTAEFSSRTSDNTYVAMYHNLEHSPRLIGAMEPQARLLTADLGDSKCATV